MQERLLSEVGDLLAEADQTLKGAAAQRLARDLEGQTYALDGIKRAALDAQHAVAELNASIRAATEGLNVSTPGHGMEGVGVGGSAARLTPAERDRRRRRRKTARAARKAHR